MSKNGWVNIDIDSLELLEVTEIEKMRVKNYVLNKHNKPSPWKNIAIFAALIAGITTVTGFAFPTIAAQIPIVNSVVRYINDDFNRFTKFEQFSNDIGLVQSSNGITIMIDKAVYDGRNISVSYIVETETNINTDLVPSRLNWFSVNGASLNIGGESIRSISDTQYGGLINYIPLFPNDEFPETVQITMNPDYFYSSTHNLVVNGDWLFEFSLTRLDSVIKLINETTMHPEVKFTIKSLEFTDVSTIMEYEQLVTSQLLASWGTVFPTFHISDNLGHVYMDGIEEWGGGITVKKEVLHTGTTTFGAVDKRASQLIIKPIAVQSIFNSEIQTNIELEPMVIELN